MFEKLKRLYEADRLTETGLQNAVAKGWITAEEMQEIMTQSAQEIPETETE